MAKGKFESTKPISRVGTIGHLDSRKLALTAAITAVLSKKFEGGHSGLPEHHNIDESIQETSKLREIEQDIESFNNEHYIE